MLRVCVLGAHNNQGMCSAAGNSNNVAVFHP
jgi:hypothetical protein